MSLRDMRSRGAASICLAVFVFMWGAACSGDARAGVNPGLLAPRYPTPEDCPRFATPQFLSQPLTMAYPGIEYNIRPAIKGGTYPYAFKLVKAPKDMTIDPKKGTVIWTAPKVEGKTFPVEILVKDTAGRTVTQAFELTVSRKGFYFASPEGDDAAPGTLEKPWKTFMRARSAEGIEDAATAIIYLRGGDYRIHSPAAPGSKAANKLGFGKGRPKRWIAFPGEKPVIDFGWSAEKQQAVLAEQKAAGTRRPTTRAYGHRFTLFTGADGFYFDGIEVKNTCYYTFMLWNGEKNVTWRRCHFHHLYSDERENSAFIHTKKQGGKYQKWGIRSKVNAYQHMIIQDCQFRDRFFRPARGGHGGAIVLYTVHNSIIEDCLFERIHGSGPMAVINDKLDGWGNTYRGNVIHGPNGFALLGGRYNDEIEICHNRISGKLLLGVGNGWLRNIWAHHNTLHGTVKLMYGASTPPRRLEEQGDFSSIWTPDVIRIVRELPANRRTIHFYGNIIASQDDGRAALALQTGKWYAERFRFIRMEDNLIGSSVKIIARYKNRKFSDAAKLRDAGFHPSNIVAPLTLDRDGYLPKESPYFGRYGRQLPEPEDETTPAR